MRSGTDCRLLYGRAREGDSRTMHPRENGRGGGYGSALRKMLRYRWSVAVCILLDQKHKPQKHLRRFGCTTDVPPARISEQLQELGHEVSVANVRELRAISHSDRKSDEVHAKKLARYARLDPNILRPIANRTVQQQEALTLVRVRALLVRRRTAAVNAVRGLTESCGYRMPASARPCFAQRSLAVTPPGLAQTLGPGAPADRGDDTEDQAVRPAIQQLGQIEYLETQALLKVHGVGHLTALTFVLTLSSKERFGRSRDVGCYWACDRGEVSPEITMLSSGSPMPMLESF
jgi:Transposase